jgi:hypothetical protein
MTDLKNLPDDVDRLKQLVFERDSALAAVSARLLEAQVRLEQLQLLFEQSGRMKHPAAVHTRVAASTGAGNMHLKSMPNFAGWECGCPQCGGRS